MCIRDREYYSKTTYVRLFIAEMFPEIDKAIYIDSDTVVLGDIAQLYAYDLGDAYVGACKEQVMIQEDVYLSLIHIYAIKNSKKIAKAAGIKPSELKVHALGLISGMFYTTKFDKIGLFLPKYLYGKQYRKAPFAAYVNPENPELLYALAPAWLVTSHNDHLRNYTIRFEKALTAAKKERCV